MALASAKQLLDELMGRDRDFADKKSTFSWDSHDICKHFLVNFCPHDLFVNTKADLGTCSKLHDERLKGEYEKSSRFQKMGYEEDFLRFCQSMLSDVEKRIRRAKQRLALSNAHAESQPPPTPKNNNEEKINVISERINGLLVQVEHLGCEGKVEEAQGIMKLCDQLKDEREDLRKQAESTHWLQTAEIAAAQEKQMEVCDVCGAFLIVGDAQQRVDDHLQGRQHVGYARVKEAVEEILNNREKERSDRDKQREKDREERKKVKDDEDRKRSSGRDKRNEDDDNRRDVDRHRRDRDKRRSRSRERRRSRSPRRANLRSRSRDRNKREKERSRQRTRSRERRHRRSRSRDKDPSSRSREKDPSSRSREKDPKSRSREKDTESRSSRREKSRSRSQDRRDKDKKHRSGDRRRHSHENGASSPNKADSKESKGKENSLAGDSDH